MTLRTYSRTRGTSAMLALALGLSPCVISSWVHGRRRVPVMHCLSIERITKGAVRADTLRPDVDWSRMKRGR
jgi:DNA-binding transcriptional regulator YdaS (Cro superfamily)